MSSLNQPWQMDLFMYRIIYAELVVLLYWKHTVCIQIGGVLWLCDSHSVWQDSETPRLDIQQTLKTLHQSTFHQLCSLHSTAPRKGSVMFRFVVCMWRSFVFILVFMIPLSNLFGSVFWDLKQQYRKYQLSDPHTKADCVSQRWWFNPVALCEDVVLCVCVVYQLCQCESLHSYYCCWASDILAKGVCGCDS